MSSSTYAARPAAASSSVGAPTAAQLAPYYRANGTAVLTSAAPVVLTANDFVFQPNTLSAKVGTRVRLQIRNVSSGTHNFTLPAFGVDASLPAGRTTTVTFTASRRGMYYFWCALPGHAQAGMVGTLTVS